MRRGLMAAGSRALSGSAGRVPRVLVTRDLGAAGNDRLEKLVEEGRLVLEQHRSSEPMSAAALGESLSKGVDGVLCLLSDGLSGEVLALAGEDLKVVSTLSVGVSHIDVEYCRAHDVAIGYTPGVLTDATADLGVTLLLSVARMVPAAMEAVKSGAWTSWKPFWMTGKAVAGSTVGVVGLGRIGMGVADRMAGFKCNILYATASGPKDEAEAKGYHHTPLDTLLAESDFVVLTCALTDATHHLLSTPQFEAMKDDAILVNIARGEVVDQEALLHALQSKTIAAAGLDVTTPEPLPTDSPLLQLDNCLVLPHIGSATASCREEMAQIAIENMLNVVLEGKDPKCKY